MEKYFEKFLKNIQLTPSQREDAKKKYDGVCRKLHENYYPHKDYDGSNKLLIGSYGKRTNIRPARDIDVIFKMPQFSFIKYDLVNSNGQSNLLQDIRSILIEKYPNTPIKAFGKVVVVEFSEPNHNIEVLPGFELEDGRVKIPNSTEGGCWEIWDPRAEIARIDESDKASGGKTRLLVRMLKKWEEKCSVNLKSYKIESAVIKFLDINGSNFDSTPSMLLDFFAFLEQEVEEDNKSYVSTALNRVKKAIGCQESGKLLKAIFEWKKIFGNDFPSQSALKETAKLDEYYSPKEEYIEDYYKVELIEDYFIKLDCNVTQDGFRPNLLSKLRFLHKRKKLQFFIAKCNVPEPFQVKWKVRNFGDEAKRNNQLRGEIWSDTGKRKKFETTLYHGDHYVECYIIKDNKVVTYDKIDVPIRN